MFLKIIILAVGNWSHVTMVKNICCPVRGPESSSLHDTKQLSTAYNVQLQGIQHPLWVSVGTSPLMACTYIHACAYTHINKKFKGYILSKRIKKGNLNFTFYTFLKTNSTFILSRNPNSLPWCAHL